MGSRPANKASGSLDRRKPRVLLAMGMQNHQRQAGIVRYAREAGWVIDSRLLSFHAAGQDYDYLHSSEYDGILALLSRLSPWLPPLLKTFSIPIVDMWADYATEPYPRVLLDNPAIGRLGAQHLVERGFRELLFYSHVIEGKGAHVRRDAFREVAVAANAKFHELSWDHKSPASRQGPVRWLANELAHLPLPLGVMGANDHIASEVLEAAQFANLAVPDQVAVLGVDNDPLVTELAPVPLSSIDSAREEAGYQAAALLDRLMKGEAPPSEIIYIAPSRVVTRRSTNVLAVQDRGVAAALRFIQNRFAEPITVDDVVAGSFVSRRQLQDLFQKETGHTIAEAVTRQRLEHAKELLLSTDTKIHAIAQQAGFASSERMSKVFRRVMGVTPQGYRLSYRNRADEARG